MFTIVRWTVRLALVGFTLAVLYVGITFGQVLWDSHQDSAKPASAIVVMGAAQWDGRPSPVFAARLDHAVELYEQGLARAIVVTGGKQVGDRVTQGQAGATYLREQGVPEEAIQVEIAGTNSYEELSASALIVKNAGLAPDVLIVTDPYHAKRVTEIASEVGLHASVSPTGTSQTFDSLAKETAAVSLGRIVGYRRLASWS